MDTQHPMNNSEKHMVTGYWAWCGKRQRKTEYCSGDDGKKGNQMMIHILNNNYVIDMVFCRLFLSTIIEVFNYKNNIEVTYKTLSPIIPSIRKATIKLLTKTNKPFMKDM